MPTNEHDDRNRKMTRRDFVQAGVAAASATLLPSPAFAAPPPTRKRYVLVGTGIRAVWFLASVLHHHKDHLDLVGLCDTNPGRLAFAEKLCHRQKVEPSTYSDRAFDQMIEVEKPDVVFVTTMDSTHDHYIVRAMELGCDVITEKPMTTDAKRCQRILDAQKATGRQCRVTFNYRYSPPRTQIKDLLMKGAIGDVLSVDFQWMLNTDHGADYFRRWHSEKRYSGGLMVHKATHHFDLMNWWLSAVPVSVYASGKRAFYTPGMAKRLGLSSHHERCLTCPEKEACGFYLDIGSSYYKQLYLDHEGHDGYQRDRCVFRPDIDIEDTMNVVVTYDDGVQMSYSLNAFNAWEGYRVVFNGTQGRIEHTAREKVYVSGDGGVQGGFKDGGVTTTVFPLRGEAKEVDVWEGKGGHGGGDRLLLQDLFDPAAPADPYLRAADYRAGAYSILTGVAANESMATGQPVRIGDLVTGLDRPDYPTMPPRDAPLTMPT